MVNATASKKKRDRNGSHVRTRCFAMAPARGGQCGNGAERMGSSGVWFHIVRPLPVDDGVKGIASPPSSLTPLLVGLRACHRHQCMFGVEVLGNEQAVFIDVYSPATTRILGEFASGRRISPKDC